MRKRLLCLWIITICMLAACKTNDKEEVNDSKATYEKTTVDLNSELAEVEAQSDELVKKFQDDTTQMELNQTARDWYDLWDAELNSLWNRISDTVDEDTKSMILAEQRSWIVDKEAAVAEAGEFYEGGSMQSFIENKRAAKLTRARCYVLATYLGEAIGQTVEALKIDYAGTYVDTQGTMESYSDLSITEESDGTYHVEVNIYRLAALEGTAKLEGEVLKFIDEEIDVKGDIVVDDESAVLTITESDWEYIENGDRFDFPEKW